MTLVSMSKDSSASAKATEKVADTQRWTLLHEASKWGISIDKMNSKLGYHLWNIHLIHLVVNLMKGCLSLEDDIKIYSWMVEHKIHLRSTGEKKQFGNYLCCPTYILRVRFNMSKKR